MSAIDRPPLNDESILRGHQLHTFTLAAGGSFRHKELKTILPRFIHQFPLSNDATYPSEWLTTPALARLIANDWCELLRRFYPPIEQQLGTYQQARIARALERSPLVGNRPRQGHSPTQEPPSQSTTTEQQNPSSSQSRQQSQTQHQTPTTSVDEEIIRFPMAPPVNNQGAPAPIFSEQQMAALRQVVAEVMAGAAQNREQERAGPATNPNAGTERPLGWRDSEVGFFHPDLDISYGDSDAVTVGTDMVFRDVHLFIDRLRDAAAYRGDAMVRERIPALLRGSAQMWYSTGLDAMVKVGLRHSPVEHWFTTLREQFKRPLSESLRALSLMKYTLRDAQMRRPVAQYIFAITRSARDVGLTEPRQQLAYAYNGLDVVLRQGMAELGPEITIAGFVRTLETQRDTWAGIASMWLRNPQPFTNHPTTYKFQRPGYGQYTQNPQAASWRYRNTAAMPTQEPRNTSQRTNLYQQPNQTQGQIANDTAQRQQLPPPPTRLAIADGTTAPRYDQARPFRPYGKQGGDNKWQKPYASRAYYAVGDEEWTSDNNNNEEQWEDPYEPYFIDGEPYDQEGPQFQYDPQFQNENDEVVTTVHSAHVDTPRDDLNRCDTCNETFLTSNRLHAHLRETNHQRRTKN